MVILDNIKINAVAKFVYSLYVKGVNDAVKSKDFQAIKNFLEDYEEIGRFSFLYEEELNYMQYRDAVVYINSTSSGVIHILDMLRMHNAKNGLPYALCLLAFEFYKIGLNDGKEVNYDDNIDILNKNKYYEWGIGKKINRFQFIDKIKHVTNMLYLNSGKSTPLGRLSVFIGKLHYQEKVNRMIKK